MVDGSEVSLGRPRPPTFGLRPLIGTPRSIEVERLVAAQVLFQAWSHVVLSAGRIVVARKGMAVVRITAKGRASHAGSRHGHGANALVQMAEVILRLHALTDYERGPRLGFL